MNIVRCDARRKRGQVRTGVRLAGEEVEAVDEPHGVRVENRPRLTPRRATRGADESFVSQEVSAPHGIVVHETASDRAERRRNERSVHVRRGHVVDAVDCHAHDRPSPYDGGGVHVIGLGARRLGTFST